MKTTISAAAVMCALSFQAYSACASTISAPPPSSGFNTQSLSANVTTANNVWNGIGQSFTDQDPRIEAGFYIVNTSGHDVTGSQFQYSLYAGDGISGAPIDVVTAMASIKNFGAPVLTLADFSAVSLTPGKKYTLVVSLLGGGYPPIGQYSELSAAYNSTSGDTRGSFYYSGSSYDPELFIGRTLAFQVQGIGEGVPEPATWAIMMVGIAGLGVALRSRRGACSSISQGSSRLSSNAATAIKPSAL